MSGTVVKFGATVSIINLDNDKESKYQLVGEVEAERRVRVQREYGREQLDLRLKA